MASGVRAVAKERQRLATYSDSRGTRATQEIAQGRIVDTLRELLMGHDSVAADGTLRSLGVRGGIR